MLIHKERKMDGDGSTSHDTLFTQQTETLQEICIHSDGRLVIFNTHLILLIQLIPSSFLSNLKPNNYNKNETQIRTMATPI